MGIELHGKRSLARHVGVTCALIGLVGLAGCGGEETPLWCEAEGGLETSCEGPGCVAVVVVDYARIEPRGYTVLRPQGEPIKLADAGALALNHLTQILEVEAPPGVDCEQEDQFIHCAMVYDSRDQYLVVIHQPTGQVLFAEFGLSGHPVKRGYDFPLPRGFSNASALGCVDPVDPPERQRLVRTGFPLSGAIASTPDDALEVARRLNLTRQLTEGHAYRAFVISHAPARDEFDAESADWYVWMEIR
jgi:hypothetical protein